MRFDETVANHRKMWNWIADETLRRKDFVYKPNYFVSIGLDSEKWPLCNCYCCEYARADCFFCPLEWTTADGDSSVCYYGGQFGRWKDAIGANNWEEAARLAKEIANLPERGRNEDDY